MVPGVNDDESCIACQHSLRAKKWTARSVGVSQHSKRNAFFLSDDPPDATNGFKPEYFRKSSPGFEEQNFWFRAQNRLIQWALDITSDAEVSSRLAVEPDLFSKGVSETLPRMRLAGSEIFSDGRSLRGPFAGVDLSRWMHARFRSRRDFDVIGDSMFSNRRRR